MKKYIIFFSLCISGCQYCLAQPVRHITYSYDNTGNRVHREYCICRLANPADSLKEDELKTNYGLSVYPNPATESINISISDLKEGTEAVITLFDAQSKQLYMSSQKSKQQNINISRYPVGIYFLEVCIEKQRLSYRVQKN